MLGFGAYSTVLHFTEKEVIKFLLLRVGGFLLFSGDFFP